YAGSFAALLALGHVPGAGLGAAYGSMAAAAAIWCVLSIPLKGLSVIGLFARFLRAPLISGIIVILTMVQVANVAFPNWLGNRMTPGFPVISIASGLIAVAVLIVATIWGGKYFRRIAVLLALLFGTLFFAAYQPVSLAGVMAAPIFVAPSL